MVHVVFLEEFLKAIHCMNTDSWELSSKLAGCGKCRQKRGLGWGFCWTSGKNQGGPTTRKVPTFQSLIRWTWLLFAIGVWLSPNSSSLPVLTLFGSTNLNSRSAHIDTELSFLMIIPSESAASESMQGENDATSMALRRKLDSEISGIRSNAVEWQGGSRKVRWTTKLIVWLLKGMLWWWSTHKRWWLCLAGPWVELVEDAQFEICKVRMIRLVMLSLRITCYILLGRNWMSSHLIL